MGIKQLASVKCIEQRFPTGEEPVLVLCSDWKTYVCKYMRSSSAAYKLVCEFIGGQMAGLWKLYTPQVALVNVKNEHWPLYVKHCNNVRSLGSCRIANVIDITPSTFNAVTPSERLFEQLLKIALFDCWIANEDRNANNANLLYDINAELLVSIDYGCILNTATFDFPLSQLTSTDTILYSALFKHIWEKQDNVDIDLILDHLNTDYHQCLKRAQREADAIIQAVPQEWNVPLERLGQKI